MHPNEDLLRQHFRRLRADDERQAPSFEDQLLRAQARRQAPTRLRIHRLVPLGLAATLALAVAVTVTLWPRSQPMPDVLSWESPTQELLGWPLALHADAPAPPGDDAPLPPLDAWQAPSDVLLAPLLDVPLQ